jgi:hypothetical protein
MGEPWLRHDQKHSSQQENYSYDHHEEPGIDASHTSLIHASLSFHWYADHGTSVADETSIR